MKKALIASTALLLTAGVAAADVTISGYGRTGIIYYDQDVPGLNNAQVISRLRMNLDASTSTDSGIDFGARFRLQWDQGSSTRGDKASTNAGKLWISSQGLTVEVGNVDTAFDSNGLIYETELGAFDRSVGFSDVSGAFFAYKSDAYSDVDRVGVRALYTVDNLTVQGSFVDPDQSGLNETEFTEEEFGVSIDYKWDDRLELSAAAAFNGAGIDGNDIFFLGARYAVQENARVGLNYVDAGDEEDGFDGATVAIYGDYTLADGRTNLEGYVAYNDADRDIATWKETNTSFGIGVNYDLGGARLGASIQRDYAKNTTADMGVRFNF
ncbi:porin [Paracoccus methylovorus]|uniref:Porin n=1 Tax=Paracoccus methylovorus TaxID=2812658 RepID=A0ABX7JFZ3_9RHOB|nr:MULTISPECIES: porin [Paracoccus]QRZ13125.1 porin [Paracoccus methylovorus]